MRELNRRAQGAVVGCIIMALGTGLGTQWVAAQSAPAAVGPDPAATMTGQYVAGVLVNDARGVLRDTRLPPEVAAKQAAILLQFAVRLDEADLHALRMLVEAARTAGMADAEKETLRKVISADPGDLVAQVQYIDLLAAASQTLEERSRVYQAALQQTALDAQIRSEIAVRLARIAEERGDSDQAHKLLAQAVALNDVNVPALREQVRMAAESPRHGPAATMERVNALIALLLANPYQPDAWLQVAQVGEQANLHDRAANFLMTAAEQSQIDGSPPNGQLYLDLATELATAGRRGEAFQLAGSLAALPDAPLTAVIVALAAAPDGTAPATAAGGAGGGGRGAGAATLPTRDKLTQEIHQRLVESVKGGGATALADAAGVELSFFPTPGAEVAGWIADYAKLVAPEDVTLARLQGWQLYRAGKLPEAKAVLEKAAAQDGLAQVGLARVLSAAGNKSEAARQLQEVWSGHPTGLLALQTAETARQGNLPLADTEWTKTVRDAMTRLTPAVITMHRTPREVSPLAVGLRKNAVGYGEAAMLTVRVTNASARALPVGPDGVVKTTVGLAALVRGAGVVGGRAGEAGGANPGALGLYAMEDLQRVYRLEPRQAVEATVRVDQGTLGDLFEQNPARGFGVTVTAVTVPRIISATEYSAGVGGQAVTPADVERGGISLATPADFARLLQEVGAKAGEAGAVGVPRQVARIEAAGALWRTLAEDKAVMGAGSGALGMPQEARAKLAAALRAALASDDALVRAMAARALPRNPDETMALDASPLVRLMQVKQLGEAALRGGDLGAKARAALEKERAAEKDELVKGWIEAALQAASAQPAAK